MNMFLRFFFFLVLNGLWGCASACWQEKCIAIVDVGSTGSRISIFSYDLDADRWPIAVTERWSRKVQKGLSTFNKEPQQIFAYLDDLFLTWPLEEPIPIYVYATGGMRELSQDSQAFLYEKVRAWFAQKPFLELKELRTIRGDEEAIFAWLSVNSKKEQILQGEESFGVMDFGGASVQIVFPIKDTVGDFSEDIKSIILNGHRVTLYAKSFLGLGQTHILARFADDPACFMWDKVLPSGLLGQGDAQTCRRHISEFIQNHYQVDRAIQSIRLANEPSRWYVMGGLVYLFQSPVFSEISQPSIGGLFDEAERVVCSASQFVIDARYFESFYRDTWCLLPAYYHALLVGAYGISPKKTLWISHEINQNWVYGALIYLETARSYDVRAIVQYAILAVKNIAGLKNSLYTSGTAVVAQSVEQLIRNQ